MPRPEPICTRCGHRNAREVIYRTSVPGVVCADESACARRQEWPRPAEARAPVPLDAAEVERRQMIGDRLRAWAARKREEVEA